MTRRLLFFKVDILGSVGAVVHQEELNVLGVVDEESLVAGGHHVAGLLVGAITDLGPRIDRSIIEFTGEKSNPDLDLKKVMGRIVHANNTLETATDAVINTLGLAPRGTDTHKAVRLVAEEAGGVCCEQR